MLHRLKIGQKIGNKLASTVDHGYQVCSQFFMPTPIAFKKIHNPGKVTKFAADIK